jgi:catechol 2,3-dioxygenase-like lactoylglutathione lyase family enzyme
MIRHLAGLAEIVEDVDAAVAFYEGLGLTVKRDNPGDEYAVAEIPGVLHFGIWGRAAAAESTYGSRDAADRVPLGFTIGIEVDSVDEAATALAQRVVGEPHDEPWGQRVARFTSPSGALCEVSETPQARELDTNVKAKEVQTAGA